MTCVDLIEVARYPNSCEAALARNYLEVNNIPACLNGEAMASWFWQYGTAIGGVKLLVEHGQSEEAIRLLAGLKAENEQWDASEAAGDSEVSFEAEFTSEIPPDLLRAWRAAVMSPFFLPLLLNVYSTWVLLKNQFFLDESGRTNWRVHVAMLINLCVFGMTFWLFWAVVSSRTSYTNVVPSNSTFTLPIVPSESADFE